MSSSKRRSFKTQESFVFREFEILHFIRDPKLSIIR